MLGRSLSCSGITLECASAVNSNCEMEFPSRGVMAYPTDIALSPWRPFERMSRTFDKMASAEEDLV
jgi:hypothetical protein